MRPTRFTPHKPESPSGWDFVNATKTETWFRCKACWSYFWVIGYKPPGECPRCKDPKIKESNEAGPKLLGRSES